MASNLIAKMIPSLSFLFASLIAMASNLVAMASNQTVERQIGDVLGIAIHCYLLPIEKDPKNKPKPAPPEIMASTSLLNRCLKGAVDIVAKSIHVKIEDSLSHPSRLFFVLTE